VVPSTTNNSRTTRRRFRRVVVLSRTESSSKEDAETGGYVRSNANANSDDIQIQKDIMRDSRQRMREEWQQHDDNSKANGSLLRSQRASTLNVDLSESSDENESEPTSTSILSVLASRVPFPIVSALSLTDDDRPHSVPLGYLLAAGTTAALGDVSLCSALVVLLALYEGPPVLAALGAVLFDVMVQLLHINFSTLVLDGHYAGSAASTGGFLLPIVAFSVVVGATEGVSSVSSVGEFGSREEERVRGAVGGYGGDDEDDGVVGRKDQQGLPVSIVDDLRQWDQKLFERERTRTQDEILRESSDGK